MAIGQHEEMRQSQCRWSINSHQSLFLPSAICSSGSIAGRANAGRTELKGVEWPSGRQKARSTQRPDGECEIFGVLLVILDQGTDFVRGGGPR